MGSRPTHNVSVWACQYTTAHGPLKEDKTAGMSAPGAPRAPSSAWPSLHPSGTGRPPKTSPANKLQAFRILTDGGTQDCQTHCLLGTRCGCCARQSGLTARPLSSSLIRHILSFASSSSVVCELRLTVEEQDVAICILVGRGKRHMPSELQERSLEDKLSARTNLYLCQASHGSQSCLGCCDLSRHLRVDIPLPLPGSLGLSRAARL